MEESDTYLAIIDEGQVMFAREAILLLGEERFGQPPEEVKVHLSNVMELNRLRRMVRRAATAASWQEILDTP